MRGPSANREQGTTQDVASSDAWQRVLWKAQPFPDNYIPPSFLSSLRRNANVLPYTYSQLFVSTCSVTQHVSCIFIFLAVFLRLQDSSLDPRVLVWISIACFVIGYAVWDLSRSAEVARLDRRQQRIKAIKSSLLVFLALIALSPVLKTLTEATSSDSIWALAACLFMGNALLADYGSASSHAAREPLTSVLSMNAAISASVVLASRLSSNLHVFALILFAIQLFALYPILRRRPQSSSSIPVIFVTSSLAVLSVALLAALSSTVSALVGGSLAFITFVCPAVLVWAQRYKNELKGPWDPAVPRVR